jgi:replicative DNA helicase
MASEKELSIDDQLNIQVQKILREKEKTQKQMKQIVGKFNKL